ncbi:uncharacterized protein LOC116207429 isoform X1 [Punica granatum]|uniref:Uncharacterized protein LOC116207429 isoform X1 n=1 Tax=Punica granatum TaxID=22663 RepID=A0A6P8DSG8_PUNGR|nr:uncharacterized protein LOC116207429 isoform X1 [Punica granatum]
MASPAVPYSIDDKDLDDATLWALMDSAAASISSKSRKPLQIKHSNHQTSTPASYYSPPLPKSGQAYNPRPMQYSPQPEMKFLRDGEVVQQEQWTYSRPQKFARTCSPEASETSPLALVRSVHRTPTTPARSTPETYLSPEIGQSSGNLKRSPVCYVQSEENEAPRHSLSGKFPSVSLFKEYQNAAMAILETTDYTMISGHPFIKKSGWRKISCYFNLSFEIKDKSIEFDQNRDVQRAEFVVRAYMQGGRFSDGWGSCDRREKRFLKPNHDIPSTAETRAKNKACQVLVLISKSAVTYFSLMHLNEKSLHH